MYSRSGKYLEEFQSLMPGGSHLTQHKGYAMFDTIVSYETNTFYILDLMAWCNQSLMECDVRRYHGLKFIFLISLLDLCPLFINISFHCLVYLQNVFKTSTYIY